MASILTASIDVTKVNKEKLSKGKYLNLTIVVNDEVGKYGDALYIAEAQTMEERESKADKNFLGNGRVVWTNGNNVDVTPKKEDMATADSDSDLPWID